MEDLKKQVLAGKIFIYPTDTIYGLGCNALDVCAVEKIRKVKLPTASYGASKN